MKEEWKKVKLGELYEVHNGLSKGGKFFGFGYPFLSFSTIFNNWFIPERIKDLVQSTEVERANFSVKAGDVFITRTSETADELGMSCVALKDYPNATYNGFCKRLRPIESDYSLNYKYIGYYLRTKSFRNNFLGLSGAMTTRASLKNDDLLAMEITLPPLPTQQKIASVLSAYDDLIENNRRQIKLLEEAALKLYKEWFVKLNFPGHENTKIVDGIPEGWKEVAIGNLCIRVNAGGTPNRKKTEYWDKHEVKWFKTKELQDCWLFDAEEYISEKGLNNSSAKIFPENTILMAIYASPTLGRLGILTDDACCNQAALCMIADEEKISYQWLYLKLMELRDYFNSVARGAGQQNISGDVVKNKIVLVPEKKLMEEFTSITKPYFNKIKNCQLSIVNLQLARDKLLPKLMNGEIEV